MVRRGPFELTLVHPSGEPLPEVEKDGQFYAVAVRRGGQLWHCAGGGPSTKAAFSWPVSCAPPVQLPERLQSLHELLGVILPCHASHPARPAQRPGPLPPRSFTLLPLYQSPGHMFQAHVTVHPHLQTAQMMMQGIYHTVRGGCVGLLLRAAAPAAPAVLAHVTASGRNSCSQHC